jgi:hypothetical protein
MSSDAQAQPQPLFYKKAEPLDFARHGKLGVKANSDLDFAKIATTVFLTAPEFAVASRNYPIVFSNNPEPAPLAILGVRNFANLFVKDGQWTPNTYVPAYVRRYPFIFMETPDKSKLVLCIDAESDAIEENGARKFFSESGELTEFTNNALQFCKSYQQEYEQTRQMVALLKKHDLLVNRQAEITLSDGRKSAITDFLAVDEQRLGELSDKAFLELRRGGVLPLVYFHLMSLLNLHDLANRYGQSSSAAGGA